ncbi:unnamed protein product [Cuscuta campestris]|uniref:Phytochrome n=1 Tax=Cuscuta campestris TaxID=132261 RepID=A0A484MKE1_9ASTE|nr:unnamed protein product [Cuscuta campestris]
MSSRSGTKRTSSDRSRHDARVVSQTLIDAKLHGDFEESEENFDYSTSVNLSNTANFPSSTVSAYLQKMQRGSLIQPFGCLIAIDKKKLAVLGFSENAAEMLDLAPCAVPSIEQQEALTIGTDVRTLFRSTGAVALEKAARFEEVTLLNPILVHSRNSGKPFYAILHRIDVGLVIDLEPVDPEELPVTAAGAMKSYKLASKSISRLQSLPSGDISLLCDVLVREMADLTGYDRIMVYKFHEDDHGEVVAECCSKPDLEPYLGLHYPATDIPQASRFLFMKNKLRMICDCLAPSFKVVQDKMLVQPLSLCGSTLRAPHGCHAQYMANMGSIASLAMSVMINENGDEMASEDQENGRKLWGLVVCHHSSPRFVPYPLRHACEFLVQVFSVQINKEVEVATQRHEKHILRIQMVLCDMLLRDSPVGIVTKSPNIMDLVRCDGAALYYRDKIWLLGSTPTEPQIRDIAKWLLDSHGGSTGLSTDSLMEAGYNNASTLSDLVCGMAAVKITSNDFLFWFRSHTAKAIKWGGAKHDPMDKDDGRKMHPRSSFKAFLEVVKKSLPWEDVEMDAIHSLQLILRGSLQDDRCRMIVDVSTPAADPTSMQTADELQIVTNEMVRLIETASIPILAVDASGCINGWNSKVSELTGLALGQAMGLPLVDLVLTEAVGTITSALSLALQGEEEKNVEIKLKKFDSKENEDHVVLVANACSSRDTKGDIVGICFVGQDVTGKELIMDKYNRIQGDYAGILHSPSALIPPIFMMDEHGRCLEWNDAMQKLTGLKRDEAIGHMILGEVFTVSSFGCKVKDNDTLTKLMILLNGVLAGQDLQELIFGFFDKKNKYVEALISANKRAEMAGRVSGVLCFLHVPSPELQHAIHVQKLSEQAAANSLKNLAYIRHGIRNPLNGIKYVQDSMKSSNLSKDQSLLLETSVSCQEQLAKILDDTDIESIEECYMEMNCIKFCLGDTIKAVVNQAMIPSVEWQVEVECDFPFDPSSLFLFGDNLRVQQVLSDFLTAALLFTPHFEDSSVLFSVIPRRESLGAKIHLLHLEFRITHPAPGIPEELIQEMFKRNRNMSREGLGLYISHKLVKIMNGTVQYVRETERSSFIIFVEFPVA